MKLKTKGKVVAFLLALILCVSGAGTNLVFAEEEGNIQIEEAVSVLPEETGLTSEEVPYESEEKATEVIAEEEKAEEVSERESADETEPLEAAESLSETEPVPETEQTEEEAKEKPVMMLSLGNDKEASGANDPAAGPVMALHGTSISRDDIKAFFGQSDSGNVYYGIRADGSLKTSEVKDGSPKQVSSGGYTLYRTTAKTVMGPNWTKGIGKAVTLSCYYNASFGTSGAAGGAVLLNGEPAEGEYKLYTDSKYMITTLPVKGYDCELTGAEEGVEFSPEKDMQVEALYKEKTSADIELKNTADGAMLTKEALSELFGEETSAGFHYAVSKTDGTELVEVTDSAAVATGSYLIYKTDDISEGWGNAKKLTLNVRGYWAGNFSTTGCVSGEIYLNGAAAEGDVKLFDDSEYTVTVKNVERFTYVLKGANEGTAFYPSEDIDVIAEYTETAQELERKNEASFTRLDAINIFDDSKLSVNTYGLERIGDGEVKTLSVTSEIPVASGMYRVYRRGMMESEWKSSILVKIRCYWEGTFSVTGSEDGEIYLDGAAVSGTVKLYDDTEYTVTAKSVDKYVYEIAGASDGVPFIPEKDLAITAEYMKNAFARLTIQAGEGGTVEVFSEGKPVLTRVEEGKGFEVVITPDTENGYYPESASITCGGEPVEGLVVGAVEDGEEYVINVSFAKAEAFLDGGEVNIIDIKKGNLGALIGQIIGESTITPDDFAMGADYQVSYRAFEASLVDKEPWKALDYEVPNIYKVTHHAFGEEKPFGEVKEGNTETVRISVTNEKYPGIVLRAEAEFTAADLRIRTITDGGSFSIVYGDDLKEAVLANVHVAGEDGTRPEVMPEDIEIDPETLDVKLLTRQTVKVAYKGNDEYAPSEGTAAVYVIPKCASLDVENETIRYGETPSVTVTTDPEDLDYIRVIAGIDGDACGFISIDIPESTKEAMRIREPITGAVIVDLYRVLADKIGDGVSLNGLKEIFAGIREIFSNELIRGLAEAAGFDVESLDKVLELIESVPTISLNAKVTLSNPPKNAGLYLVGAVSTDINYIIQADIGYLAILPETNAEVRFNQDIGDHVLTWTEAQSFDFGAGIYAGDKELDPGYMRMRFTGISSSGKIITSDEPVRRSGAYNQFVYSFGGNYLPAPADRCYKVLKQSVTIEAEDLRVPYDTKPHSPEFKAVAEDGTDLTGELKLVYTGIGYLSTFAPTVPGTYLVTATYPGSDERCPAVETAFLVIEKAKVTITMKDIEVTYGDIPSRKAEPKLEYKVEGLQGSDKICGINPYIIKGRQYPDAGTYTIGCTYSCHPFYDVEVVPGTLTILPKGVTVTIDYKEKRYTEKDPQLTCSYEPLPYGEKLKIMLVRDPGEEVGTYRIHALYEKDSNYLVSFIAENPDAPPAKAMRFAKAEVTGIFRITPMPVKILVDDKAKYEGDPDPELTAVITDDNGKTLDAAACGVSLSREPGEEPGEYPIYAKLESTGYVLSEPVEPGTLTISVLTYIVSIDSKEKTYGDADPEFTAVVTDVKGNPVDPSAIGMTLTRDAGEDVGTYAIKAVFEDPEMAKITEVTEGKLTILAKADPGKKDPVVPTGDANGTVLPLYLLLIIACTAEVFFLSAKRRKMNNK